MGYSICGWRLRKKNTSNLIVGFWRGVNQYQGEKVWIESCSHPTYSIIHSYTQLYKLYTVIHSHTVIQLPSTWTNTPVCCNTPSLTSIREPGWINHLPDHHYPHHRKQLGETCHSVQSCIGIRLTAFFSVLFSHFFSCFLVYYLACLRFVNMSYS